MNCGLCRDCKWWGIKDGEPPYLCRKLAEADAMMLTAWDWVAVEGYTLPDFGCVQFEVKA